MMSFQSLMSGVLKQNEAALKNLAAQARGEVTIREALQEINVWGAETEFSLTEVRRF